MIYYYNTARGIATLNKGDDRPLVNLGLYKTETQALESCKKHFEKVCKALTNFGKPLPQARYL